MALPKHIESFDIEQGQIMGDPASVIVTLCWGFSFSAYEHEGVRGFDGISNARYESARKWVFTCTCTDCQQGAKKFIEGEVI